jgi:hypothetical protein
LADAARERLADDQLGVLLEVAVEDPPHVRALGRLAGGPAQALALELAEVEHRLVVTPREAAAEVDVAVVDGVGDLVQGVDLERELAVALELAGEHLDGGDGVGLGAVGVLELLVAIEAHRGGEAARLLLVVDDLGVDDADAAEVEQLAAAHELGLEHADVEAADVEAGDVAAGQECEQLVGGLGEVRLVGDILVVDAVDLAGLERDADVRVDPPRPRRADALPRGRS